MIRSRLVSIVLTLVLVVAGHGTALAAGPVKYSGRIVVIDITRGRLIIDEIGRQVPGRFAEVIRRTIVLTPTTDYLIALRANPLGGFPGDFIAGQLESDDMEVGDLVTADCLRDGSRLIARTVTLVETARP